MLPKPGKDSKQPSSYRPISLLNTLGKLLERIIARRLGEHFRDTSFFNEWQRAYQHGKEATEIFFHLGEEIIAASAKGWVTSAVSLDVEKAFDAVWHDGLRYKLSSLGLPVKLCRFLSSFLHERTIRVRQGATLSQPVVLRAGTPQGSVLSPLLFLVYVNDIPIQPTGNCRAGQFADDMNLWTSSRTIPMSQVRLQRALKHIEDWCSKWRIKLNVGKTQLVSFSRRQKRLDLKLFGQNLDIGRELKVLGVTFGQQGSLVPHCRARATIARQRLNLMRLVSGRTWGANQQALLRLYQQYVRPCLEYGYVLTARASKTAVRCLTTVETKALRVATHSPPYRRNAELYAATGIVPLPQRLEELRSKAIVRFGDSAMMTQLRATQAILGRD